MASEWLKGRDYIVVYGVGVGMVSGGVARDESTR